MTTTQTVAASVPERTFPLPTDLPTDRLAHPTDEQIEALLPKIELIADDGRNMDSEIHRMNMELLLSAIACRFQGRDDYHAGGNSFIYYSTEQARNREFRGPDFFFVKEVPREPLREYWCVWEERGRYPDVIIELLSPSTRRVDLTTKKSLYEKTFHTGNYFCYDPDTREFMGWKLELPNGYVEIKPNPDGRLWCDELNLWLGVWDGPHWGHHRAWLRFFSPEGQVIPIPEELAETAIKQAQAAELEAGKAKLDAEAAQRRAEAAEAELAKLKAMLAEQGKTST